MPSAQENQSGASLWAKVGALVASRTSHGDTTICLERIAFWLTFLLCALQWARGLDVPSSLGAFLNVLVAAVLGQSTLSTVGFVARKATDASVAVAAQQSAADSTTLVIDNNDHTLSRQDN